MSTTTFQAQGVHGHRSDPDAVASLLLDLTELDAPVFYQSELSPHAEKIDSAEVGHVHAPALLTFYRSLLSSLTQESVSWSRLSHTALSRWNAPHWPQTHFTHGYASALLAHHTLPTSFDADEYDAPDFPVVVENPRSDITALVRAATNNAGRTIEIIPEIDDDEWL